MISDELTKASKEEAKKAAFSDDMEVDGGTGWGWVSASQLFFSFSAAFHSGQNNNFMQNSWLYNSEHDRDVMSIFARLFLIVVIVRLWWTKEEEKNVSLSFATCPCWWRKFSNLVFILIKLLLLLLVNLLATKRWDFDSMKQVFLIPKIVLMVLSMLVVRWLSWWITQERMMRNLCGGQHSTMHL